LESTPIIDIRAVSDPSSVALELVKYLTKDIDANGDKIDPDLYAKVYCALDGHRSVQASRGFMKRGEPTEHACECGASLPRRVKRKASKTEKQESKP
jgi:hypothetical protein